MEKIRSFGAYLKKLLNSRGIKTFELAEKLNIDPSLVRKWVAGSRVPPLKSSYYDFLCRCLDLDPGERRRLKRAQLCSIDETIIILADLQKTDDRADEYKEALISLLHAIPEAAFLLDGGRIIAANEITARRLGISAAEIIGRDAFQHLPPAVAEHRKKLVRQVLDSGQPLKFKDYREDRCILNSLYPVKDNNGLVTKIAICGTDITELETLYASFRESEERRRLIFDNSMEPMLLTRPDGAILAANPAACRFFQMTEQEICAAGRSGLVDPDDKNPADARAETKSSGKAKARLTFITNSGARKTAWVTSVQLHDRTGRLASYIIIHVIAPFPF